MEGTPTVAAFALSPIIKDGLQLQGVGCDGRHVQVAQVIRASWNAFSIPPKFLAVGRVFLLCVEGRKISADICVAAVASWKDGSAPAARFCVQLLLKRGATTLSSQTP